MGEAAKAIFLMLDWLKTSTVEIAFHKGLYVGGSVGFIAGFAAATLIVTLAAWVKGLFKRS